MQKTSLSAYKEKMGLDIYLCLHTRRKFTCKRHLCLHPKRKCACRRPLCLYTKRKCTCRRHQTGEISVSTLSLQIQVFLCVKCTSSSTSRRRKKNKNNNNNKHHHTSCGCGMCWWGMSDDMYVTTQRRMRVAVELVGKNQVAEHQAHLEMLTVATLAYTGVCSAGAQGEIQSSAPSKKKNPISLSPLLSFLLLLCK